MQVIYGHNVTELLLAFGFKKDYERPEEHKTRYQGEHTFVDLWVTRRGVTLGIYLPKAKRMRYARPKTIEQFEEEIEKASRI